MKNTSTNSEPSRRHPSPPEDLKKEYGENLAGPAQVARLLDISVSELKRRVKDGIYPCIRDERGWLWFDEREIRHLARIEDPNLPKKRGPAPRVGHSQVTTMSYTADVAAEVFKQLAQDKSLPEIVGICEVHPETVLLIKDAYARLCGGIFLRKEHLERLNENQQLELRGKWPPTTVEECFATLKNAVTPSKCVACSKVSARLCAACASGKQSAPTKQGNAA